MAVLRRPIPWIVALAALAGVWAMAREKRSPAATAAKPAVQPVAATALHFTDVSAAAGLDYHWGNGGKHPLTLVEIMGGGAGAIDFDMDGWPDIVLVGKGGIALYHNEKNLHFRNVTADSGLDNLKGWWFGCAAGDYDSDGYPDLVITGFGQSVLLHNEAGGEGRRVFRRTTVLDSLESDYWTTSAAFADVNRDGRLDIYLGAYLLDKPEHEQFARNRGVKLTAGPVTFPAQKGTLFLNRGNGQFEDVTSESGLKTAHGKTLAVGFCDYDDDGWDDLYLANDEVPGDLMRNKGAPNGIPQFTNIGDASGTSVDANGNIQGGMGVAWGDFDRDGLIDLFVPTFTNQPKSLYHNKGKSIFNECSYLAGISQTTTPWVAFGTAWVDFTNKGWPDLMIANGHVEDLIHQVDPANDYPQKTQLFESLKNGKFRDVSTLAGDPFQKPIVGRALAAADFDNDGRVDILIADQEGAPLLLHNHSDTAGGHWVTLDIRSHGGWSAIGARVEIVADGKKQLREVRADGSYLAASDPRVHFGIGSATKIEALRIRWPGKPWQNVAPPIVDKPITIREP